MTTHMHSPSSATTSARSAPDRRGAVRRWFAPLGSATTWKETAALLLALPTSVAWFSVAVTGVSASAALMVTVVGIPVTILLLRCGRFVGAAERAGARALLGTDLPAFPPISREGTWWERGRRMLTDRPSWKGIAYALFSLPLAIVTTTTAIVLWSVTVAATAFPVYQAFLTASDTADVPEAFESILHGWGRVGFAVGAGALGIVLLGLTPRIVHRLADVQRAVIRRWLSPA